MRSIHFQNGLAYKQAKSSVAIAITLGMVLGGIQIYLDYFTVKNDLHNTVNQVLKTISKPVAAAIVEKDQNLSEDLIRGLFEYEPIYKAQIYDETGKSILFEKKNLQQAEFRWLSDLVFGISEESETILTVLSKPDPFDPPLILNVGTLKVSSDTYLLGFNFLKRVGHTITLGIVHNSLLLFLLTFLFQRYLLYPFQQLETELTKIQASGFEKTQQVSHIQQGMLEFEKLVLAINQYLQHIGKEWKSLQTTIESKIQEIKKRDEQLEVVTTRLATANHQLENEIHVRIKNEFDLKTYHKKIESTNEELRETLVSLRQAQQRLVVQEKLASLGELTAGISHEIRNPLNFIINFAELGSELLLELKEKFQNAEIDVEKHGLDETISMIKRSIDTIYIQGKRIDRIVQSMLLHSRGQSGPSEIVDLHNLLQEYFTLAFHSMRAKDASFMVQKTLDFDESLAQIQVVPEDIGRVFLNIINNSLYAISEKMKSSEDDYTPSMKISTKGLDKKVEIRIWDNGNGIPKPVIGKIFNPFFTTKPPGSGTGLGLSLSHEIITQAHQGTLEVRSEEGEYTEFVITLPNRHE